MSVARVVVVGSGVIGAWTAWHLRRLGTDVTLVDAWGAANSRSTSGDETRILRVAYGDQPHYIDLTLASIPQWDELAQEAGAAFFHRCGALWLFDEEDSYVTSSLRHLTSRRIRVDRLDLRDAAKRFPQVNWSDVVSAYHEPQAGFVLARKSVQAVVARLQKKASQLVLALNNTTVQPSKLTPMSSRAGLGSGNYFPK
jgi:sarcosine oxidase